MKIKKGFVLRKVGDEQYAVATGEALKSFKGMLKLNETGAFIFTLLNDSVSIDEIVKKTTEEFDGNESEIRADAEAFIEKLRQIGVIEE